MGRGAPPLPRELIVHTGSARTPARVRVLGGGAGPDADPGDAVLAPEAVLAPDEAAALPGQGPVSGPPLIARLALRDPLPLHAGDRVLLRDPGAAGLFILGATVLDVAPPPLRRRGAAAAAAQDIARWPDPPGARDLLRRHGLLRTAALAAMGVTGAPEPVAAGWLADEAFWAEARDRLAALVAEHAARDPLSLGVPIEAARAALGLPDRRLAEALAAGAPGVTMTEGYLRPGRPAASAEPARSVPVKVPGSSGSGPGLVTGSGPGLVSGSGPGPVSGPGPGAAGAGGPGSAVGPGRRPVPGTRGGPAP